MRDQSGREELNDILDAEMLDDSVHDFIFVKPNRRTRRPDDYKSSKGLFLSTSQFVLFYIL